MPLRVRRIKIPSERAAHPSLGAPASRRRVREVLTFDHAPRLRYISSRILSHDRSLNSSVGPLPRTVTNGGNLSGLSRFLCSTWRKPSSTRERNVLFSFCASRCVRSKRSSAISTVAFIIWQPIFAHMATHSKEMQLLSNGVVEWWSAGIHAASRPHNLNSARI